MILTVDAGSPQTRGAILMDAWKHGVEVENLVGYQLEIWGGDERRIMDLISRHPSAKILHKELVKEVGFGYDV